MTTPAQQAEADRVELVYYWALNQLGAALTMDSLDLWGTVPASAQAARSSRWLSESIDQLGEFRAVATELAVAYYRLVRALRTGYTVAVAGESAGTTLTLDSLRDQFELVVDDIDRETKGASAPNWNTDPAATYDDEPPLEPGDTDVQIEVEYIYDIEDVVGQLEDDAVEEAGLVLDALGTENLMVKLDQAEKKRKPDTEDTTPVDSEQAHADAGNRQAAAAQRIMLNAARGIIYNLADADERIVGWVRYSQTGDPCGWCAMLLSRGLVYKTRAQAGGVLANGEVKYGVAAKDQDKYHDNCHCVAVPIFLPEQYNTGSLFDQNRELDRLWRQYIKGKYSGPDALNAWRRLLRRRANTPALAAA